MLNRGGQNGIHNSGYEPMANYIGNLGDNIIHGSSSDDYLGAHEGDDILNGYAGNDTLYGGEGNDTLNGGDGDDALWGLGGNDVFDGGAGDDILRIFDGDDVATGGSGNDLFELRGAPKGSLTITDFNAGDGSNDQINLFASHWVWEGLSIPKNFDQLMLATTQIGNDAHIALNEEFTIILENVDKIDLIADDFMEFAPDRIGSEGDDILRDGGRFGGTFEGYGGDDIIDGSSRMDLMYGGDGNDTLNAGYGHDVLVGGAGDDILTGSTTGNGDRASSTNRFEFAANHGHDTITDLILGNDRIDLSAIFDGTFEQLMDVAMDTPDGVLIATGPDAIAYISGGSTPPLSQAALEALIQNSSQSITIEGITKDQLTEYNFHFSDNNQIDGTLANDVMTGTDGDNVIHGGAGDDSIFGWAGDNTIYGGDGNDRIFVGGIDYTSVAGGDNHLDGGAGNDRINGHHGADTIIGGDGNDHLSGYGGDDILDGGAGDDTLYFRNALPDTVHDVNNQFSGGNDIMTGGAGDDTFVAYANMFDAGGLSAPRGTMTITDFNAGAGSEDRIELSGGYFYRTGLDIPRDFDEVLAISTQVNNDTHIALTNDFTIILENVIVTDLVDEDFTNYLEPRWGSEGDDVMTGNTLRGHGGNDTLTGGTGNSGILGGDGNDIISGGDGDDRLYGDGGNDTIDGGDDEDIIRGGDGDDTIDGGAGDDIVSGGHGDDIVDGGAGNDTIYGAQGNDTLTGGTSGSAGDRFMFNFSDFGDDTVTDFSLGTDKIELPADYTGGFQDLLNATVDTADGAKITLDQGTITLTGISKSQLSANDFAGMTGPEIQIGGDERDEIDGSNGSDIIEGRGGNDRLDGKGGNDTIHGGDGDDYIYVGYGTNVLNGDAGNDMIYGGGDDTIDGGTGDDEINGGGGTDVITGGSGNDKFVIDQDHGTVTITDFTAGTGAIDTIDIRHFKYEYSSDEFKDLVSFEKLMDVSTQVGNDTHIAFGRDITVILQNVNKADLIEEDFINYVPNTFATDGDDVLVVNPRQEAYGGDGNDIINGNTSANYLYGEAGSDVLNGNGGADDLFGGSGNDTLNGDGGHDKLFGEHGDDTLNGGIGNDTLVGGDGADTFIFGVGTGSDVVTDFSPGSDKVDITGTFDGTFAELMGQSVDTTDGVRITVGTDSIMLTGLTRESLSESDFIGLTADTGATEGNDFLRGSALADAILGLAGDDNLAGAAGNDTLNGGAGADMLSGGSGEDTLDGGDGADSLLGGAGNDIIGGGADNDWIRGEDGDDTLSGGAGRDKLFGEDGDDRLDGGASNDIMTGGTGDDTYVVDHGADVITEAADEGTDTVESSIDYTLGANIENLTLTGTGDIDGTGNAAANVIVGNGGDNVIGGGAGDDTLTGGGGADTFVVSPESYLNVDTITDFAVGSDRIDISPVFSGSFEELLALATDTVDGVRIALDGNTLAVMAGATEPLTATQEAALSANGINPDAAKLILTGVTKADLSAADFIGLTIPASDGNDMISGTINADAMWGLDGDDTLQGGDGDDALDGGAGNDALYGGTGGDTLIGGDGSDHIQGDAGNDTLNGDGGNDWMLGGDGDDTIKGGAGRDRLFGHDGNDTLDGGISNDTMTGGLGDDTYVVDHSLDVVNENADEGTDTVTSSISYTLGATLENLTLTGDSDLDGTGNDGVNILTGNDGANTLTAGAGNDALYGNDGDDVLNAGDGGDHVQGDAGNDTLNGEGGNDWMLGGTGNDILNGGAGRDRLFGNDGDDTLDGGISNDTMTGGAGDDTYVVDHTLDAVVEAADEGTDTVQSSISYTLGDNLENLSLSGSATIDGLGNGGDNTIIGNSGANVLTGNGGSDTLRGMDGNDTLNGGSAFDALYGGNGADTLNAGAGGDHVQGDAGDDTLNGEGGNDWMLGGSGNDTVNGGDGNDRMFGNDGNDRMTGGAGADRMAGGAGDDVFVYTALSDAGDTITDFDATGDLFELSALMTAIGYAGSDAVGDGYVGITQSGANTLVQVDADGGGDGFTTLATLENVTATDIDMGTWNF